MKNLRTKRNKLHKNDKNDTEKLYQFKRARQQLEKEV